MALNFVTLPAAPKAVTFVDAAHCTSEDADCPLFASYSLTKDDLVRIRKFSVIVNDNLLRAVEANCIFDCHFQGEEEVRLCDWKLVVTDKEFWVTAELKHSAHRWESDINSIDAIVHKFANAISGDTIYLSDEDQAEAYRDSLLSNFGGSNDKPVILALARLLQTRTVGDEISSLGSLPHLQFDFEGQSLIFTDAMQTYFEFIGVRFVKKSARLSADMSVTALFLADPESLGIIEKLIAELETAQATLEPASTSSVSSEAWTLLP
jgi:hypothetical protein